MRKRKYDVSFVFVILLVIAYVRVCVCVDLFREGFWGRGMLELLNLI